MINTILSLLTIEQLQSVITMPTNSINMYLRKIVIMRHNKVLKTSYYYCFSNLFLVCTYLYQLYVQALSGLLLRTAKVFRALTRADLLIFPRQPIKIQYPLRERNPFEAFDWSRSAYGGCRKASTFYIKISKRWW